MRHVHVARLTFAAAAFVVLGCKVPTGEEGHKDPANGTGLTKDWAFTMSLAHNNFTVAQNATDTNIVTFTRVGGFTGPIHLSFLNPDSGVVLTSEPITATGTVTTTRLMTHVNGPHNPFANAVYGLSAQAADSTEVEGQFTNVNFSIVRKDGTFTIAPAAMSVGRGQSVQQRISIIRTNYTVPVPMNIINAPTGMTATFSPNPIADTVTQMTLSVDASVPEGVYNIGVRANEGTNFQGTAPVAVTVTAPGSFTLSTTVNPLAVPKGQTVPAGINITRTNFSGPISFTVNGVPAGVTTTFASPVTGNNFSVSFTNPASGVSGSFPITITGSAAGLTSQVVTLTVNF